MANNRLLSIVIPVFNEQDFILTVISKVSSALTPSFDKEIIIIDDGSNDQTASKIRLAQKNYQKKNLQIKLISQNKNQGKGAALKVGFLATAGDFVLVQDADLEYSPNDYPTLLEPFLQFDADAVFGSRFISNRPHRVLYFWHYLLNLSLTTLSNIFTNLNLTDMETGFKAFKGDIIRKIAPKLESQRFGFEPEITARLSRIKDLKLYEVGISYQGRTYEQGKKINWTDGLKAIWEIFKYNLFTHH